MVSIIITIIICFFALIILSNIFTVFSEAIFDYIEACAEAKRKQGQEDSHD